MKTITLADIARKIGMDPKVARAKARRRAVELNAESDKAREWVWDKKAEKKVTEFLKSDLRRVA